MSKQQIIVFVGPDKCGKTEIGNELGRRLNIPTFKASTEKGKFRNEEDFILEMQYADPRMIDILKQTGYSLILDRAWPCEWVYSTAFNRDTDGEAIFNSDQGFADLGAKVVVCYRSSYNGLVDEDAPDRLTPPVLEKLEQLYRSFSQMSACEFYFLNVDDEDLDREVDEIMTFINEEIN